MAGLLDIFDTEEGRLGLGLLMAAAPRADRTGFGDRLGDAFGFVERSRLAKQDRADKDQERAMRQQLQAAQIGNYQSEAAARDAEIARKAGLQRMLGGLFGGQDVSPGAFATAADGMGPVMPAQQRGGGGLSGLTIDQVAGIKAMGGPDLLEAWKLQNVGTPMSAGAYVTRADGSREYLPDPSKGIMYGANGDSVRPGFAEANAAIKGAEAAATARGAAGFDMVTVNTPNGPVMMTRAQAAQLSGGGQQRQPNPYPDGGTRDTANAESIRILQSELRNARDPGVIAGLQREIKRLQDQSPGIRLQPEEDRIRANEQAKADVTPTAQKQSAMAAATYLNDIISKAIEHPGRETTTGLSGWIDPRNYIAGTNAKDYSALHDQIKGNVFLQAFNNLKGGGAITELEGKQATAAIARMNTTQSDSEYLNALKEFQGVVQAGIERMKGAGTSSAQTQSSGATPLPKNPTASSLTRGQRYDLGNGKVGVWDGMGFKVE